MRELLKGKIRRNKLRRREILKVRRRQDDSLAAANGLAFHPQLGGTFDSWMLLVASGSAPAGPLEI